MPKMSKNLRAEYLNKGTVLTEVDEAESDMNASVFQMVGEEIGSIGGHSDRDELNETPIIEYVNDENEEDNTPVGNNE